MSELVEGGALGLAKKARKLLESGDAVCILYDYYFHTHVFLFVLTLIPKTKNRKIFVLLVISQTGQPSQPNKNQTKPKKINKKKRLTQFVPKFMNKAQKKRHL